MTGELHYNIAETCGGIAAGAAARAGGDTDMKIVHGDEVPFLRGLQYRCGTFHSRNLMEGETGTIGNFSLVLGRNEGDFFSPRHRHNFEQIRFAFEGTLDFSKTGKMAEGMIGYFPEAVSYGPQVQAEGNVST